LRALKSSAVANSLLKSRGYASDQGAIWAGVHELARQSSVTSPTGAMRDLFEARRKSLDDYLRAFPPLPRQKGLLVLVNGEVAGLDIVSREEAYRTLHPKFIRSHAMDALVDQREPSHELPREKAMAFSEQVSKCSESRYESVGQGTDYRFQSEKAAGSALVHEGTVIHMNFYPSRGVPRPGAAIRKQFRRWFSVWDDPPGGPTKA
jgi:hypothetical protein